MNKIKSFIEEYTHSAVFLFLIAVCASFFFTFTFVINRAISLDGGEWYWSATLRFIYTLLFLSIGFLAFKGIDYFKMILKEYVSYFRFWTITGTIGFGFFYSLICYAADYSPAWVVATCFQISIIASLFVLAYFGQKLSKKVWLTTFIIFLGITLVNLSHVDLNNLQPLILGFIPLLISAFSYPIGNQLVWNEKNRRESKKENSLVMKNAFAKVFLMTLGSFPLWIILYFVTDPAPPTSGQYLSVAVIALFSGIIATSLFLYARSHANTSNKLIIIDATASIEVIFALFAEILFLGLAFPNMIGVSGIIITILGLFILTKSK